MRHFGGDPLLFLVLKSRGPKRNTFQVGCGIIYQQPHPTLLGRTGTLTAGLTSSTRFEQLIVLGMSCSTISRVANVACSFRNDRFFFSSVSLTTSHLGVVVDDVITLQLNHGDVMGQSGLHCESSTDKEEGNKTSQSPWRLIGTGARVLTIC